MEWVEQTKIPLLQFAESTFLPKIPSEIVWGAKCKDKPISTMQNAKSLILGCIMQIVCNYGCKLSIKPVSHVKKVLLFFIWICFY